jgi:hypothetical protein
MPRRVPELSAEIAREGCDRDAACWRRDRSPFRQPPSKARNGGAKWQPGRLFFGYFLLAKQKKVTRLRGRDPDSNNRRGSDTSFAVRDSSSKCWVETASTQPTRLNIVTGSSRLKAGLMQAYDYLGTFKTDP